MIASQPARAIRGVSRKLRESIRLKKVKDVDTRVYVPPLSLPIAEEDWESFFTGGKVSPIKKGTHFSTVEIPDKKLLDRITCFVKSSCDTELLKTAAENKLRLVGSSSSISGPLSHFFYLLHPPEINQSCFSPYFRHDIAKLTRRALSINISVLRNRRFISPDLWAVDAFNTSIGNAGSEFLANAGNILESKLTMSPDLFSKCFIEKSMYPAPAVHAYRYSSINAMLTRSQLDTRHDALLDYYDGRDVFDIKTRATFKVRFDAENYLDHQGKYSLDLEGRDHSYEREVRDMARSTFLKNYFQVRLGDMAGIVVGFHDTKRMFGFQFFSSRHIEHYLGFENQEVDFFDVAMHGFSTSVDKITQDHQGSDTDVMMLTCYRNNEVLIYTEQLSKRRSNRIVPLEHLHVGSFMLNEKATIRDDVNLRKTILGSANHTHTPGKPHPLYEMYDRNTQSSDNSIRKYSIRFDPESCTFTLTRPKYDARSLRREYKQLLRDVMH